MLTVPFENLDIPLGHPIVLSLPSFYDKIVRRRRGGFCYELNGLFGWLLEQLGFAVLMLSALVFHGVPPGPEFDHLVLLIEMEERLIADVGFGDSFLEPLTQKAICSLAIQGGRIILSNDRLIDGRRAARGTGVAGEEEYRALLNTYFGIELNKVIRVVQWEAALFLVILPSKNNLLSKLPDSRHL
jgi:arylamine N-acetyltransferase